MTADPLDLARRAGPRGEQLTVASEQPDRVRSLVADCRQELPLVSLQLADRLDFDGFLQKQGVVESQEMRRQRVDEAICSELRRVT